MTLSQVRTSGSASETPEHSEVPGVPETPKVSETPAAEGHRALRALFLKYGYNPENSSLDPLIADLEQAYTQDLERVCTDLSGKDNATGFRLLFLAGQEWNKNFVRSSGMLGITRDERLVTASFKTPEETESAIANPMQVLKPGRVNPTLNLDINEIMHSVYPLKSFNSRIDHYSRQYHLDRQMRNEFDQVLQNCIHRHLLLVLKTIRNALDPALLQTMKECRLTHSGHVCWLTGGDGVSRKIIQARQQAIRAYPAMAVTFYLSDYFRNVIDTRTSLKTAIAQKYQVDESKIRRLSGLMEIFPNRILETHIQDILDLPDEVVPGTGAEFRDLKLFEEFGQCLYEESMIDILWRLSEHGNPLRLTDRIRQTSGRNVSDAVDFLARKLFVPACLNRIRILSSGPEPTRKHNRIQCEDMEHEETEHENMEHEDMQYEDMEHEDMQYEDNSSIHGLARNEILSSFSATELLDFSERYHRNIMRYEDRLNIISVNYDWPGLFGTLDFGNGYTARELTSSRQLKTQGLTEDHCVGGYASRVLDGNLYQKAVTVIFSIEKDGTCLGTTEVECGPDIGNALYGQIVQNQARGNTPPSRDAENIAEQIRNHISRADPAILSRYCDALELVRRETGLASGFSKEIIACGFDPYDRTHFDLVWNELRSALPRRMRRDDLDGFIRNAEFNRCHITMPEKLRKFRLSKNPDSEDPDSEDPIRIVREDRTSENDENDNNNGKNRNDNNNNNNNGKDRNNGNNGNDNNNNNNNNNEKDRNNRNNGKDRNYENDDDFKPGR